MYRVHRLRKNEEFQQIFKNGKSYASRYFVIYILKNENHSSFRVGISVSKKLGNAVVRNRVKRMIKEVIRKIHTHIKPGCDFIIIVRQAVSGMNYHEIDDKLKYILQKAKLMDRSDDSNENH